MNPRIRLLAVKEFRELFDCLSYANCSRAGRDKYTAKSTAAHLHTNMIYAFVFVQQNH
jgi:hypothetical protein